MTIKFYTNTSKRTMTQKVLTNETTYEGTLRDSCDVIDPIVQIEITTFPFNLNYARIEAFGRYYFVTNVINVRNGLWEIRFHVDVLMTYWDYYKYSPSVISRSETLRTADLVDNRLWATKDRLTGIKLSSLDPFAVPGGVTPCFWVAVLTGISGSPEDETQGGSTVDDDGYGGSGGGNF